MDPYSVNQRLNQLEKFKNEVKTIQGNLNKSIFERLDNLEKKAEGFAKDIQNIHLSLIKEGVDMEWVDQLEHYTLQLQESVKDLFKLTAEMNTHRNGLTIRIAELEARMNKLEYSPRAGDSPL